MLSAIIWNWTKGMYAACALCVCVAYSFCAMFIRHVIIIYNSRRTKIQSALFIFFFLLFIRGYLAFVKIPYFLNTYAIFFRSLSHFLLSPLSAFYFSLGFFWVIAIAFVIYLPNLNATIWAPLFSSSFHYDCFLLIFFTFACESWKNRDGKTKSENYSSWQNRLMFRNYKR